MAENRAVSARPTSHTYQILAGVAAFGTAVSAGCAIALGTLPDAWAAGGFMIAVPLILAVVTTLGLAGAWHILLRFAAHAKPLHERAIAVGFAVALFLIGTGSSCWFLVSLIGGEAAEESYRLAYVERLKNAASTISGNATIEASLIDALDAAGGNLAGTAESEAKQGLISGKVGRKVVYATLKNASDSFAAKSTALKKTQDTRSQALTRADAAIDDATRAAGAGDSSAFEEAVAKGASELRGAADTRLAINDLGAGMSIDYARAPISQAINDVAAVMRDINSRRRHVEVPFYHPISPRMAVVVSPQPLAWIVAIVIETLPLIFLGLLLTLWRDEEPPSAEIHPFGRKQPFVAAAE